MRTRRRLLLPVVVILAAVLLAVGLVGWLNFPTGETHWSSADEMRGSTDGLAVPTLVAADARDIDLRVAQFDRAGVQVRWRSMSGITRSDCKAGPISGTSQVGAGWWPKAAGSTGWICGWWKVFKKDGFYYAWHDPRMDGIS